MSHAIAEVILPPDVDVEAGVKLAMWGNQYGEPADQYKEDDKPSWWDWYKIGGRFSGSKALARLDQEKLKAFMEKLKNLGPICSDVQFGRQEVLGEHKELVDSMWRSEFPGAGNECLLFNHARDQYRKAGYYEDDVCTIAELPTSLTCERLVIVTKLVGKPHVIYMLACSFWNGVVHQSTDFSGSVQDGLVMWNAEYERMYKDNDNILRLESNWKAATVDFHS